MSTSLTRRSIVSATPAALAATCLPALAASASHPDAELLGLDAQLGQALALSSILAERCDEAYERFKPPPIPDALCWRRSDFPSVWIDKARLDSIGTPDVNERFIYASDGVLDSLRTTAAEWRATAQIDRGFSDRSLARVEEIIAALEVHYTEEAKRYADCGYTAADEAHDAQHAIVEELRERIVNIPARTTEGVCVKVRAMLGGRSADLIEQGCFASLLAKPTRLPHETNDLLSLSAMIDAAKLGAANASGDRRAA